MSDEKIGRVTLGNTYMEYVAFGEGKRNFVILPGLSIAGVSGAAEMLAELYGLFANEYRVYFLDRKNDVPEGYSVYDMADDTAEAMKLIGIEKACLMGVSQGGMIAQVLASKYPEKAEKLVLTATLSRQNDTVSKAIGNWLKYAEEGDFEALNKSMFELLFTENYLKKNSFMLPAAIKMKPEDPKKFLILARSCLTFDCYDELDKIKCPALVIGAELDEVVSPEASGEIAEKLGCEIYMYAGYKHGVYDEAEDFKQRVYDFLKN